MTAMPDRVFGSSRRSGTRDDFLLSIFYGVACFGVVTSVTLSFKQSGRRWGSSGPGTTVNWCRGRPSTSGWKLRLPVSFDVGSPIARRGMCSGSLSSCRVPNSGVSPAHVPGAPRRPRLRISSTEWNTWLCAPREPRSRRGTPFFKSSLVVTLLNIITQYLACLMSAFGYFLKRHPRECVRCWGTRCPGNAVHSHLRKFLEARRGIGRHGG